MLTALTRIPFRSRYLFSWDAGNFALALQHFNVAFHQPQPPGYILYVGAARLVHLLAPDANASYVWLSVGASGLAVTLCVLVGVRLFGGLIGLLGGALLAGSSVFWGQGLVAYPYAFLALFTSLAALLAIETKWGARDRSVLLAGVIGLGGGFRPELIPLLLPLWVYASHERWRAPRSRRWPRPVVGVLVTAAAIAAWYVPSVVLSGGWAAYQRASVEYYATVLSKTSGYGKLLLALLENVRTLTTYVYNGVGLALVPMLYFAGRFFSPQRLVTDARARFLLAWLAPPLGFYVVAHIGNPGYVLSFLPALCLYAAVATRGMVEDAREAAGLLARAEREQPARRTSRLASGPSAAFSPSPTESVTRLAARTPLPGPPGAAVAHQEPGGHSAVAQLALDGPALRGEGPRHQRTVSATATTAAVLLFAATSTLLFLFASGEGRNREIRDVDRILARQVEYIRFHHPPEQTILFAFDRSRQLRYYLPQHRIELLFTELVAGPGYDDTRYWERRRELSVPAGVSAVLFPDLGRNTTDQPGSVARRDLGDAVSIYVAEVRPGDIVRYGYQYASVGR